MKETTGTASLDVLLDPDTHARGDAGAVWGRMREDAPVHRHEPEGFPAFWSVTRYEDVRAVYTDPATFSSTEGVLLRPTASGEDPGGGRTLALTDPPRHGELRSLIAGRFSALTVRAMEQTLRAEASSVLAAASGPAGCDFAHDVAMRLSSLVICRVLGVPHADREALHGWALEAFDAAKPLTAHPELMRYIVELIDERMETTRDDALSMLVDGTVEGDLLDDEEILLNVENLVGASENAGLSMATGIEALVDRPEAWQRLREDESLVPGAVEEILRWASSAIHSMRTVVRPVTLHGRILEAGEKVVVWLPSANRDPAVFAEPDRFDLARRPNRHLALGAGEHACIGGAMARTQMRILLVEVLRNWTVERAGATVPLRSIAVSGPALLPLRLTHR